MSLAQPLVATLAVALATATSPAEPSAALAPAAAATRTGAAAGIEWSVPSRWSTGPGSAMRVATYAVPAARGAAPGECAVFFFGAGQGGSVEANVERWTKQFEGAPAAERTVTTVAGLRVTRVVLSGSYLAPGGPMMQSTGKRAGYRLLGAIVEAPAGNLFLKLTGPAATVVAAQRDFDGLVASIRKN